MEEEPEGGAGGAAGKGGLAQESRRDRLEDDGCARPVEKAPEDDRVDDVEQPRGEAAAQDHVGRPRPGHQDFRRPATSRTTPSAIAPIDSHCGTETVSLSFTDSSMPAISASCDSSV